MTQTTSKTQGPVVDEAIPDLLTVADVAALYGISKQAVNKAIQGGVLAAKQLGTAGTVWVIRPEAAAAVWRLQVSGQQPAQ